jgi:hypothetical protein
MTHPDILLSRTIAGDKDRKRETLPDIGITAEQWQQTTGKGLRNLPNVRNTDTLENKYLAGALSAAGVCAVLFGTDSPQHHAGHNLGAAR